MMKKMAILNTSPGAPVVYPYDDPGMSNPYAADPFPRPVRGGTYEVIKSPETSQYADRWVKMGNIAKKPNDNMYQVVATIDPNTKDLYASEDQWKAELKRKMAEMLAEKLVEDMTFSQLSFYDPLVADNMTKIFGRCYVFKESQMKDIIESTTVKGP